MKEKALLGFVRGAVAPSLAGHPASRLGHRAPVVLPVSGLAL